MSKNLTRKGLALAAGLTLAAGSLVAVPASADSTGPVTLLPTSGTSFVGVQGLGLAVTSTVDQLFGNTLVSATTAGTGLPDDSTDSDQELRAEFLRYLVVNEDEDGIKLTTEGTLRGYYVFTTAGAAVWGGTSNTTAGQLGTGTPAVTVSSKTITTSASKIVVVFDGATNDDTSSSNKLTVDVATQVTYDVTVKVTAWLDYQGYVDALEDSGWLAADENVSTPGRNAGFVDPLEQTSDAETITLVSERTLTATTVLSESLSQASAALSADVVLGGGVNMQQAASKVFIVFYKDGIPVEMTASSATNDTAAAVVASTTGAGADLTATSYNSTARALRGSANYWVDIDTTPNGNGNATPLPAGNYSAVAVWQGTNASSDPDLFLGATSNIVTLSDGLVANVEGAYIKGEDTKDVNYTDTSTISSADVFDVRAGVKTTTLTVQVTKLDDGATTDADTLDDDLAAANVQVRAEFTATALGASSTVSVTGATRTMTKKDDTIVAYARTDSKGVATFTITNAGAANGDNFTVVVYAVDNTGAFVADSANNGTKKKQANNAGYTWKTAAPTTFAAVNSAVSGATVDLAFTVTDNFGQPISTTSRGDLKVYMVALKNGVEDASVFARTVDVVNGSASASITNFVAAGKAETVRAYLYRSGWEAANAQAVISGGSLKTITVYNYTGISSIQVPATLTSDVTYADYRTGNSNIDTTVLKDSSLATDTGFVALNGFVSDANGAGLAAAKVEISGTGLLFRQAGIYAADKITVYTATDGSYSVDVFSKTLSPTTGIVITSATGGKTATTTLKTFLPAGLDGKNLVFTWALPATIVKNTTYAVTAKLTDKWGNPVSTRNAAGPVSGVTFTGNGSVQVNGVNTGVAANFDATGTATVFVRSVRDVAGPGSITAALGAAEYLKKDGTYQALGTVLQTVNVTTTVWDETKFVNSLSQVVDIKDVAPVTGKVNVGSFNGKLVVYASGLNGARISWKVGGNWGSAVATSNYSIFNRPTPRAGATVSVEVFVNGVKQLTKSVVTR